jgi:hypothetical protein
LWTCPAAHFACRGAVSLPYRSEKSIIFGIFLDSWIPGFQICCLLVIDRDGNSSDRIQVMGPNRTIGLFVFYAAAMCLASVLFGDELTDSDKFFLAGYEKLRAALVADDLVRANEAADELSAAGYEVPKSETLERARAGFAKTSEIAIKVASGQPGYHVMHCPMLNKDWVQTSEKISNPYGGKEMISCGSEIKK